MQERRNSSALAMELRLSCSNPSTYHITSTLPYCIYHIYIYTTQSLCHEIHSIWSSYEQLIWICSETILTQTRGQLSSSPQLNSSSGKMAIALLKWAGGHLNIKMSYQYRDPHVKDKTVLLLTWESHTWERQSLYWDGLRFLLPVDR